MFRLFSEIRRAWREGWERGAAETYSRTYGGASRIGQDASLGSASSTETRRNREKSVGIFCKRCGSRDLERVSNTHMRCSCGNWERLELADADLRPQTQHDFGVVFSGFGAAGTVRIIERDAVTREEISSRPAVKPRDWPLPKPGGGPYI